MMLYYIPYDSGNYLVVFKKIGLQLMSNMLIVCRYIFTVDLFYVVVSDRCTLVSIFISANCFVDIEGYFSNNIGMEECSVSLNILFKI